MVGCERAGKQAKILSAENVQALVAYARQTRNPLRNQVMVLLSVKAGLQAGEIANLTWDMVLEPTRQIGNTIELRDGAAKKRAGA